MPVLNEDVSKSTDEAKDLLDKEAQIEEKVGKKLEEVFGDEPADDNLDSEDSTPEEKPADGADDEDKSTPEEESTGEVNKEEKSTDEVNKEEKPEAKDGDADKDKTQEDTSPLSDAYNRAALHRGWTQEEIDSFYESNPELANRTLAKIYDEVNRVSKEYATMGRVKKERASAPVEQPAAIKDAAPSEFKGVDVSKLREEYPEDEVLLKTIEALNTQNELLTKSGSAQEVVQPSRLSPEQERAVIQESAAIEQQIDTFFGAGEMKQYTDFYGALEENATNWDKLMPGEKANRWEVIKMMDEMIAGAQIYGREMGVDEALRLAHLSVTEPIREKIIRKTIQDKVTRRSENITLLPSGTEQQTEPTGQKTTADIENAARERLSKIHW